MDPHELKRRQSWSLNQKIDHAVGAVEAFISGTGKTPYVSFSGGKDSTVLLHLVRKYVNPDIKAVFCNTGNEYPEIIRFVRQTENVTILRPETTVRKIIEKYGFPLISKEQSKYIYDLKRSDSETMRLRRLVGKKFGISYKWRFLLDEPFMVSHLCCEYLKKRPFALYEKRTGQVPILGTMAGESKLRGQQYILRGGCNSFSSKRPTSNPLSIWTDVDIWNYIRRFNIPYCSLYDIGAVRTGCMFCGFGLHLEKESRLKLLYDLHPKAYLTFLNYTNSGVTYREALHKVGIALPDENIQLSLFGDGR